MRTFNLCVSSKKTHSIPEIFNFYNGLNFFLRIQLKRLTCKIILWKVIFVVPFSLSSPGTKNEIYNPSQGVTQLLTIKRQHQNWENWKELKIQICFKCVNLVILLVFFALFFGFIVFYRRVFLLNKTTYSLKSVSVHFLNPALCIKWPADFLFFVF